MSRYVLATLLVSILSLFNIYIVIVEETCVKEQTKLAQGVFSAS